MAFGEENLGQMFGLANMINFDFNKFSFGWLYLGRG